jgi:hypothetical protein
VLRTDSDVNTSILKARPYRIRNILAIPIVSVLRLHDLQAAEAMQTGGASILIASPSTAVIVLLSPPLIVYVTDNVLILTRCWIRYIE